MRTFSRKTTNKATTSPHNVARQKKRAFGQVQQRTMVLFAGHKDRYATTLSREFESAESGKIFEGHFIPGTQASTYFFSVALFAPKTAYPAELETLPPSLNACAHRCGHRTFYAALHHKKNIYSAKLFAASHLAKPLRSP